MNAKDIAKALKCCYPLEEGISTCEGCPFDGITEPHCTERGIEYHAGETIESLLAQLDAAIARQETLQKALIESQRREQVLWENLEDAVSKNAGCVLCVHEFGWRPPEEGEPHETV